MLNTKSFDAFERSKTCNLYEQLTKLTVPYSIDNLCNIWETTSTQANYAATISAFLSATTNLLKLDGHDVQVLLFAEVELFKLLIGVLLLAEGGFMRKMDFLLTLFDMEQLSFSAFRSVISTLWIVQSAFNHPLWAESEARIYGLDIFISRVLRKVAGKTLEAVRSDSAESSLTRGEFLTIIDVYNHPAESRILETQTGGRVNSFKVLAEGRLAKKVSETEHNFYTAVLQRFPAMQVFCPRYYCDLSAGGNFEIVMENLCRDYVKPCVLDLKVGTTRWAPDSDPNRQVHIRDKEEGTLAQQIGLRISGMRVWAHDTDSFVQYPKSWGRSLHHTNFGDSLALFFSVYADRGAIYETIIPKFQCKLNSLLEWAGQQRSLRFFGTSLLLVYDGANLNFDVRLKMVDFAHVFPSDGEGDEGLVTAVRNLIQYLKAIVTGSI